MATTQLTLVSYTVYFARAIRSKHRITPTASTIIALINNWLRYYVEAGHLYRFAPKKLSQP